MQDDTQKIIQDRFSQLHPDMQAFLETPGFSEKVKAVVENQPLQDVQVNAFGTEVMLVLLGIEPLRSFTMNIKRNMEISTKRAEDISKITHRDIFVHVMSHLQQEPQPNEPIKDSSIGGVAPRQQKTTQSDSEMHAPPEEVSHATHETSSPPSNLPVSTPPVSVDRTPQPIPQKIPNAQDAVLNKPKDDSLDIFKKRLEQPVHTKTTEETVGGSERQGTTTPSSVEAIANDPYKETIE